MQRKSDGLFHPVFYFSKRTTETESKYHSFELETLAVIYAIRRFRVYIQGIAFKIVTDCNALKLTLDKKDINPRICRWSLELERFDKTLEHRAGERMKHVDAFSRAVNILIVEDNTLESNLAVCQNLDSKIRELSEQLQKEQDKLFEMRNGLVYRKRGEEILFYVPEKMENQILRKYHDELGHFGPEKTIEAILCNYWFPLMREKVKIYIANCLKCISFSPSTGKGEGYLIPIPKGDSPFHLYHIDHLGPIDKRISAKQHVLVVIDAFTKFVKLYAVKTTESKETINCLREHFRNYSRPRTMVSDRGTCFTSSEFKIFVDEDGINHVLIATASPKANGQVERVNRVLSPLLAKLSNPAIGKYWYKMLSDAEFALNNTVHSTTGVSPSKLLFGLNQRGSIMDPVAEFFEQSKQDESPRDLEQIRSKAVIKTTKAQAYNKTYYDKKHKEARKYQIGDFVMIRNYDTTPGAPKKLLPRFKGPYEVKKVLRNDRYVLGDIENFQLTQKPYVGTWEANNMKPWHTDLINVICNVYSQFSK